MFSRKRISRHDAALQRFFRRVRRAEFHPGAGHLQVPDAR